jgi:protein involved in polysaccharide export with SLBB domain
MKDAARRMILSAALAVVCSGAAAAQATLAPGTVEYPSSTPTAATASQDADRPALQHRNTRYRLCASDVLALTFPLTPEFDQTVSVQPDGFITLAGAGDVHVEGLTTQETIPAIQAAYAKILHDPIVTIELKDFNKPYFTVSGQVFKPGKFDLRGYTTATEAIAMAGGFEDSAKHSQVLLFRRVDDSWLEVKNIDLKHILQGHNVNEDVQIRPGDMLFVPQNTISKVKKFMPYYGMGAYSEFHP